MKLVGRAEGLQPRATLWNTKHYYYGLKTTNWATLPTPLFVHKGDIQSFTKVRSTAEIKFVRYEEEIPLYRGR